MKRLSGIMLVLALAACRVPYRAHPLALQATALDGGAISTETLRGRPWVIALWMPG